MDTSEQASAILELRHRTKSEPIAKQTKEDKRIGDSKYKLRSVIDSKLQAMSDEKWIASMQNFWG